MANTVVSYDKAYLATALQELLPGLIWDQVVSQRMIAQSMRSFPVPSATVAIPINNAVTGNTTALPATGSAASTANLEQRAVEIALHEYGEGVMTIAANETLTAATDVLMETVRVQARAAGDAVDQLAAAAANAIPAAGSWTYAGKTWDVQSDGLVHLGTGSTTKAARTDVTSSDTMTADMLRLAYAKLTARGARKFQTSAGEVYIAILHPNVAYDLKKQADAGSWQDAGRFIANASGLQFGVIGVYEGFLVMESSHGTSLGNVGADTDTDGTGQALYRSYFIGQDYLGKGYAPQELLPLSDPAAEIMPLSESVQIRLVPDYDSHARHKKVVWYAFLGYGLVQPDAGIIIESASSLDPVE